MRQTQNTQKNSNKKSVFVIALLLLLVAVIGFGGYTMSKYISSKKDSGKASVAKWGFEVTANGDGLFGKEYKYDSDKHVSIVNTAGGASLTVKADNEESRVAPGTTGSMTFSIGGTAEVKSHVDINFNVDSDVVLKYTATDVADGTYAPVKWTLKKDGVVVTDGATELKNVTLAKIATVLNGYDADVAANETYTHAGSYTLEWAWAFETGSDDNEKALNNKLDTFLGAIANNFDTTKDGTNTYTKAAGTSTAINFTLSISVTQLPQ